MSFKMRIGGNDHFIEILRRRPHLVVRIDGREHEVTEPSVNTDGRHRLGIGRQSFQVARAHAADHQIVRLEGQTFEVTIIDPRSEGTDDSSLLSHIRAPMPGAVVSVQKNVGDPVDRGETILTIESMKLQTALGAPRAGIIAEILRQEGETFEKDEIIVRLQDIVEEA